MASSPGKLSQNPPVRKELPRIFIPDAPFATVLVGPDETRFVIHEALLIYHSEFFRAALTSGFKEAIEKTVRLPDEDAKVFQLFVHWLYHSRFPDANKHDAQDLIDLFLYKPENSKPTSIDSLVRLYILGDRRGVSTLCRQVLDAIIGGTACSRPMVLHALSIAFDNLAIGDPLCRFLVKFVTSVSAQTDWERLFKEMSVSVTKNFSVEILRACIIALAPVSVDKTTIRGKFSPCDYHNHKDEEERRACEASKV